MSYETDLLKLENRIFILESRQPMKDNYKIVNKLKRRLRALKQKQGIK